MAYPPPVLPTNRTNATPQQNTHPADHNAVNAAVNDIVTKLNATDVVNGQQTARIDDLVARAPRMYAAANAAGISTGPGVWTNYQCGTFTLVGYTYDVLITVTIGLTSTGGGIVRLVGGLNGTQYPQGIGSVVTVAGQTVQLTAEFTAVLGPGTYNIHLFGETAAAGQMGGAFVSSLAIPR